MSYESNFKGKSAIVTGGGRGIGRAIVVKLHSLGATVIAVGRNQANLSALQAEYPGVQTVAVELGNWEATREAIEKLPAVDYLVNNAGIIIASNFLDVKEKDFDSICDVNLKAVVNVSQVVAKKMIAAGKAGSIVNVSSVAGLRAMPQACAYSTLKAGLDQLTRIMAIELAPLKIRVNSVNPGSVMTDMLTEVSKQFSSEAELEKMLAFNNRIPMEQKMIGIEEVAATTVFLLSDAAPMIVGSSIALDGGYCMA